jgi:hypothetical protein
MYFDTLGLFVGSLPHLGQNVAQFFTLPLATGVCAQLEYKNHD